MLILAIDTSCDETSIAISRDDCLLANVLSSQIQSHKEWGGVVPSLAKRKHEELFDLVLSRALKTAKVSLEEIDFFAVTKGPGLAVALEVGIKKVKDLAIKYQKPLIPINHMEGHLYSVFAKNLNGKPYDRKNSIIHQFDNSIMGKKLEITNYELRISGNNSQHVTRNTQTNSEILYQFPLLVLLISGGHTELVLMKDHGDYEILGETLDDAIGESFDKVGRLLNFGYPAGSVVEKIAEQGNENAFTLPIPMKNSGDLNMSYSGLKTATMKLVNDELGSLNKYGEKFQEALQTSKGRKLIIDNSELRIKEEDSEITNYELRSLNPIKLEIENSELKTKNSNLQTQEHVTRNPLTISNIIADISASFQKFAIEQILIKTKLALEKLEVSNLKFQILSNQSTSQQANQPTIQDLILAGGVSQNKYLRKKFKKTFPNLRIHYPNNKKLYTDNAGMIAIAGFYNAKRGKFLTKTSDIENLDRDPNWRIDEI